MKSVRLLTWFRPLTVAIAIASLFSASAVARSPFARQADPFAHLVLLTPPERVAGALPRFSAVMNQERSLPLTPQGAANLRFQAELAPILPPSPLLRPPTRESAGEIRFKPAPAPASRAPADEPRKL